MNQRQIKKFCKKGGHYHFDKTIKRISHKKMMYPYVAIACAFSIVNNHCITWHEIGTCLTCAKCTDVNIDWDGVPCMCWGDRCGGADDFTCKRYKLDPDIKFFKYMDIKSTSPDSELKRYIEESIKNLYKDNDPNSDESPSMSEVVNTCNTFSENPEADLLSKLFGDVYGVRLDAEDMDKTVSELSKAYDTVFATSGSRKVNDNIPAIGGDYDGDSLPKEDNNEG